MFAPLHHPARRAGLPLRGTRSAVRLFLPLNGAKTSLMRSLVHAFTWRCPDFPWRFGNCVSAPPSEGPYAAPFLLAFTVPLWATPPRAPRGSNCIDPTHAPLRLVGLPSKQDFYKSGRVVVAPPIVKVIISLQASTSLMMCSLTKSLA